MREIPDFLQGVDPAAVRDLDQLLTVAANDQIERVMSNVDAFRFSYMTTLDHKMNAIDAYLRLPNQDEKETVDVADEMVRYHFSHYLNEMFSAPPILNIPVRLFQAFTMADGTQEKLNIHQTGRPYIYDPDELRTRIAEILLGDDIEKVKQDILDMYDATVREIVLRFMNDS